MLKVKKGKNFIDDKISNKEFIFHYEVFIL